MISQTLQEPQKEENQERATVRGTCHPQKEMSSSEKGGWTTLDSAIQAGGGNGNNELGQAS